MRICSSHVPFVSREAYPNPTSFCSRIQSHLLTLLHHHSLPLALFDPPPVPPVYTPPPPASTSQSSPPTSPIPVPHYFPVDSSSLYTLSSSHPPDHSNPPLVHPHPDSAHQTECELVRDIISSDSHRNSHYHRQSHRPHDWYLIPKLFFCLLKVKGKCFCYFLSRRRRGPGLRRRLERSLDRGAI